MVQNPEIVGELSRCRHASSLAQALAFVNFLDYKSDVGQPSLEELEAAKRASPAQLLIRAARLVNERGLAKVKRLRPAASASHLALFAHIDFKHGTRTTEIARRMRISKQAVNQTVEELVEIGILRRAPDPSDGRAKLVRFTAKGKRELLRGLSILGEVEAQLTEALGAPRMQRLHRDLLALVRYLETPTD